VKSSKSCNIKEKWRDENIMVFIVCVNGNQTPFDSLEDANTFALETELGFPDVVIIDTYLDDIDECTRFTQ